MLYYVLLNYFHFSIRSLVNNLSSFCISVEAINLANQLCQYGYFFPVNDLKNLVLKDDSSLYRFQVSIFIGMFCLVLQNLFYSGLCVVRRVRTIGRGKRRALPEAPVLPPWAPTMWSMLSTS